jgi:N-acetyl-1-D-myo-inositol-2-amino-2-deoxy-alpha-D-glucopyranoside deacetylase
MTSVTTNHADDGAELVSDRVSAERRMLFVHAHPDDETINNGATMAKYAAAGVHVTLVTCTRGEQGEVIPDRLAHLTPSVSSRDSGSRDSGLGAHRVGELAAAMTALGVHDHRFLGDSRSPGRPAAEVLATGGTVYADSGMAYDHEGGVVPSPDPPAGAFALVDAEEPATMVAEVIVRLRPQVVVSYEPGGGYGHPDHVQAHLVTMRAVDLAVVDGWTVPKVYWPVLPESLARAGLATMAVAEGEDYHGLDPAGRLPSMVVADDQVTAAIDAIAFTAAKVAALRAHETQISVSPNDAFFALSNGRRQPILGLEFYRLARGTPAGRRDDLGRETDLFAGT